MPTIPTPLRRDDTCVIAETAQAQGTTTVLGQSHVYNNARLLERAMLIDRATIAEAATAAGDTTLRNGAYVAGQAQIQGRAVVDNARVLGNAYVSDLAHIHGGSDIHTGVLDLTADVADRQHYLNLGPIGSERRTATFYRAFDPDTQGWVGIIAAGCFRGTPAKLAQRLDDGRGWDSYSYSQTSRDRWDAEYRALIALAELRETTWNPPFASDLEFWKTQLRRDDYSVARIAEAKEVEA